MLRRSVKLFNLLSVCLNYWSGCPVCFTVEVSVRVDYLFGCLNILFKCLSYPVSFFNYLCSCVEYLSDCLNRPFGQLDNDSRYLSFCQSLGLLVWYLVSLIVLTICLSI